MLNPSTVMGRGTDGGSVAGGQRNVNFMLNFILVDAVAHSAKSRRCFDSWCGMRLGQLHHSSKLRAALLLVGRSALPAEAKQHDGNLWIT